MTGGPSMKKPILVVDDLLVVAKSMALVLENAGFQVDMVTSGQRAIERVRTKDYGLIFLDINMPGIDGIQTLRELRKIDKDVYVHFVTAFQAQYFDKLRTLKEEHIDFDLLAKPVDDKVLIEIAKDVLGD